MFQSSLRIPLFHLSSFTVSKMSKTSLFLRKHPECSNYLHYKTLWKQFLTLLLWNYNELLVFLADFNFYLSSLTVPEMLHFLRLFYRRSKYQQHWTLLNTFQFPTVKTSSRKNLYFNSFLIFIFSIKSRRAENFGNVPLSQIDEENSLFSNFELSNIKLRSLNSKSVKEFWIFLADSTILSIEFHTAATVGKITVLQKTHKNFELPAIWDTMKGVPHIDSFEW